MRTIDKLIVYHDKYCILSLIPYQNKRGRITPFFSKVHKRTSFDTKRDQPLLTTFHFTRASLLLTKIGLDQNGHNNDNYKLTLSFLKPSNHSNPKYLNSTTKPLLFWEGECQGRVAPEQKGPYLTHDFHLTPRVVRYET